jgi:transcriptional regulator with XRE-family HTH domain
MRAVRKIVDNKPRSREAEGVDPDALELGSKIRDLRRARRLTLDALADSAGVSRSLISQVERGIASPSIATLRSISKALGVPTASLFLGDAADRKGTTDRFGNQLVVRTGHRKHLYARSSETERVKYELLTPDSDRKIEFLYGEYEPGAVSPETFVTHEGEENVYCLHGSVVFVIGGDEFTLYEGDSISFDCTVPHRIENRSPRLASVIAAITPPSF